MVLTESLADKLFGQKDPIGRVVEVQRETAVQSFAVVGVMKDRLPNTRLEFDSVTFFASDIWASDLRRFTCACAPMPMSPPSSGH